jgi:2-keto-4-pentenoate hydratase/2-oxohepta-3-ene-1,7-dioic acid hydratase in catechol pathway
MENAMRLVSYVVESRPTYGVLKTDEGIVDLGARAPGNAVSLKQWVALGDSTGLRKFAALPADHKLCDVQLLPPIPDPAHVWCLAINYAEHITEINAIGIQRDRPKYPALFMRYADTLVPHDGALIMPSVSQAFDWEGELAVIIGKGGRYIDKSDAMKHVAGYSCFNDASVRDWQFHTRQIAPGKNFVATGGFGPWLVTADEVANPHDLRVSTRINGRVMQDGRTSDMIFDIPAFIEYVSSILPLEPGDVLATGTPSGVGFSRKPPIYMKVGDRAEIEVEHVGTLVNVVAADKLAPSSRITATG